MVQERTAMADEKVCIAVITGAHGVRGQVRVKSFAAEADGLTAYGPLTDAGGTRRFRIEPAGVSRGQMLARIEGVRDRRDAEALRGVELYVERDRLPPPEEDEFYHADLVGLTVRDPDGNELGTVRAMHNYGAGDLIEIARPDGRVEIMPFTRAVVPVVDLDAGFVVVNPPAEIVVRPDGGPDSSDNASAKEPDE